MFACFKKIKLALKNIASRLNKIDKLKMLLILLVSAAVGLGIMILLLAAAVEKSPHILGLFLQLIEGKAPQGIPFFVPLSFLLFFLTTLAGTVGVVYFIVVPEIQTKSSSIDAVDLLSFLLPDERKVVEILLRHGGEYLQKQISKEAGFTRVKTHRVIARLAQRGIVTVEKRGNTNVVKLNVKNIKAKNSG